MPREKSQHILAIDIGGTKLDAALFDGSFNRIGHSRTPTHAEEGPDAVFARLVRLALSLLRRCEVGLDGLHCIGVGCAGPLDSETGIVYSPPNLPGWDAFPLKEKMEKHLGLPVFVDNDANAAALGEQRFGAGRGYSNIFYVTISTGIGCGLILDGKVYRGANYSAGEFGHVVVARNGPKCNCGGRGCLEAFASGTAIARRAGRAVRKYPDSVLAQIASKRSDGPTAKDVIAAAKRGDPLAEKIFHDAVVYIGLGITSAIHLLNPEIVIIGGGIARAGKPLFDLLRETVARRAQKHIADVAEIVPARLGRKVGVYGALAVGLERISLLQPWR